MMRYFRLLLLSLLVGFASGAAAQLPPLPETGPTSLTRAQLERQLADHESALVSPNVSESEKLRIRVEADGIRQRLQLGDFRVGDRIMISVQGEASVPDTLTVAPGGVVSLGIFGEVPVGGVLRAEIADHLTRALSTQIRDPVVRATALMRVSVIGAVGQPGFYTMPAETVLGEALMVAGGPANNANLEKVHINRGAVEIMPDEVVQDALRQGLTLDQLNLLPGDQIEVPERRGFVATLGIISGVAGSLSFLVWFFVR